jgi:AraC-like DNA-binding protein
MTLSGPLIDVMQGENIRCSVPPHIHDCYAIGMTTGGVHRMSQRHATHTVGPARLVLINPHEVHAADPRCDAGWSYRMLYAYDEAIRLACGPIDDHHIRRPHFSCPVVSDRLLLRALFALCRLRREQTGGLELDVRATDTLARLFKRYAGTGQDSANLRSEPRAVVTAREYLHGHYREVVRLDVLARLVDLHPRYLIRVFRKAIGVPPYRYLDLVRVAHAQELIGRGFPLADVAALVGFSDQSHLTRHFRRAIGLTPGQYFTALGSTRHSRRRLTAKTSAG